MRTWCKILILSGLVAACGDHPTEAVPDDREMTLGPGDVAFATTSTEDGLTITTDKDDYQPGDTVWFTGAGWPANDTLDILLEDEPATHPPHQWVVSVREDGTFMDSTYVVDVDDVGVMFTLTATSRTSGRTLTVQFTDNIQSAPIEVREGTCTTAQSSFTLGATVCGRAGPVAITGGGNNDFRIQWIGPSPSTSILQTATFTNVLASSNHTNTFVPSQNGSYTVRTCAGSTNPCTGGNILSTATFTVSAPAVTATTLVVQAATGTYGGQVNLSATLTAGGSGLVGKTISFTLNGSAVGTATTAGGGVAALNNVVLSSNGTASGALIDAGSYTPGASSGVAASFAAESGPPAFATSSDNKTLTVNRASTTTSIAGVVPNPVTFGQEVTVTFEVDPQFLGTPTGTVKVKDAADNDLCSATVAAGSCAFHPASAADIDLAAHYVGTNAGGDGDANFQASSSGQQTLVVDRAPTTTSIVTVTPDPATFGQQVAVQFSVVPRDPGNYHSVVPTGTVHVKDAAANTLCSGSVSSGSCSFYPASAADLNLTAFYVGIAPGLDGDGNFLASSSSARALVVNRAATTTAITSLEPAAPAGPFYVNGLIKVNFSVTAAAGTYGSLVPTGSVEVRRDAATVLCSAVLPATSCEFTPTTIGMYELSAHYVGTAPALDGDDNFLASTSLATTITVKYVFDGFYAPVDRPNTMNVSKAGQAIPLKWRLTDANGAPITNLAAVIVRAKAQSCATGTSMDLMEEYASGSSGLQNLGNGNYQFNWKTPGSYANSCKTIDLEFGAVGLSYTEVMLAYFSFKK